MFRNEQLMFSFIFIDWLIDFLRQGFSAALESVLELTLVDYVLFYMEHLIQQVKATFQGFPILS